MGQQGEGESMLFSRKHETSTQYWVSVVDGGPTLTQHWSASRVCCTLLLSKRNSLEASRGLQAARRNYRPSKFLPRDAFLKQQGADLIIPEGAARRFP